MKNTITLFATAIAILVVAGISSCQKKISLEVKIDEKEICLPNYSVQLDEGHIATFEFDVKKIRDEFERQSLTYADNRINDLKVSSFTVKFKNGAEGSLKELAGVQVYAKKVGQAGLGKQVAEVNIPEEALAEIKLNPTGESLKEFLGEEKIVFTVTVFQRYPTGSKAICLLLTSGVIDIDAKK